MGLLFYFNFRKVITEKTSYDANNQKLSADSALRRSGLSPRRTALSLQDRVKLRIDDCKPT